MPEPFLCQNWNPGPSDHRIRALTASSCYLSHRGRAEALRAFAATLVELLASHPRTPQSYHLAKISSSPPNLRWLRRCL